MQNYDGISNNDGYNLSLQSWIALYPCIAMEFTYLIMRKKYNHCNDTRKEVYNSDCKNKISSSITVSSYKH